MAAKSTCPNLNCFLIIFFLYLIFTFFHQPNNKSFENSFTNQNKFANNNQQQRKSVDSSAHKRFKRVREEEVQIDARVGDNSFEAKVSVFFAFFFEEKEKKRTTQNRALLDH
jgi:predicted N-acyltransferase